LIVRTPEASIYMVAEAVESAPIANDWVLAEIAGNKSPHQLPTPVQSFRSHKRDCPFGPTGPDGPVDPVGPVMPVAPV
jgi:hypothetical protein